MMDFAGKVALVTGASRGIGAGIARVLGRAGVQVALHCASRRPEAERVAAEAAPKRSAVFQADLMAEDGAAALWRAALAWRGHIDILINNAGIYEPAPVLEGDDDAWRTAWRRALQVNLVAAAELSRHAVRHFVPRGGGIIVNVASRAAFRGDAMDYANYAASKGGMIALTRTHARAHAGQGVLVYAVAPGFVRTEMAEHSFRHGIDEAAVQAEIPMGDIAPVGDVANVVAFLASGLAPHATGTTVDVNGASYVR
ncbi:MAG: SDR family oxidoreductase [Alphaproteobacteria bacterium]|nr:SDR family oxidoreductase [Alphaproteobacteria bacterium]